MYYLKICIQISNGFTTLKQRSKSNYRNKILKLLNYCTNKE